MTASSKHSSSDASSYQRWQFATLSTQTEEAPETASRPMVSEAELARLTESARSEGYNAGFASGRADARDAVAAETAHLRTLAGSLDRARVALTDETAQALLALATEIAQHVLRTEISHNPRSMLPAVREALDLADGGAHPQLLLNPGDIDFVRRHLGDDLAVEQWRLTEDARIEPGGCRVMTANGAVDATLAARWRRAAAALGLQAAGAGTGDSSAVA